MKQVLEVFWQFFTLGWISFGGPAAHIGYFEKTFVQKLKWIDSESYARLISLSQFLPAQVQVR
ncbi:chromate transporter [Moritella viscosa]|uniref:Chromate transport protein n=1 Tax=Moritella viscosa TaxID=80854 RepID=A0ABY1HJY4_9GAMM|nr:chromate transporter [Moritella viscosa]SGY92844.1 Chromate transport protein [Moritella viscosa]SGZ02396.1 Chromate transport protein [Moritella viscosa]SHO25320.1 Chromate transport protein [Moritella viscosa]